MESAFTNLLILGLLIEVITNLVKNYAPAVKKKGYTTLVAGLIGIALCFLTETGSVSATGAVISYPWLDYLLTGVLLSRAAGLLNDLSKKLNK
jgi:hypothetical protein